MVQSLEAQTRRRGAGSEDATTSTVDSGASCCPLDDEMQYGATVTGSAHTPVWAEDEERVPKGRPTCGSRRACAIRKRRLSL